MNEDQVLAETRHWIDAIVVGLELCPFAKKSIDSGRLRIAYCGSDEPAALLDALRVELERLRIGDEIESTLLVHPNALRDFIDFVDFLEVVEAERVGSELEGVIQIASFHPDYQFEATAPDDIGNYTNRSPHPMLHLIREDAITRAVDTHPDPEGIPARNVERLQRLGIDALRKRLAR